MQLWMLLELEYEIFKEVSKLTVFLYRYFIFYID